MIIWVGIILSKYVWLDLIIYLEKWGLIVIFALDLPREVVGDKYSPLFY